MLICAFVAFALWLFLCIVGYRKGWHRKSKLCLLAFLCVVICGIEVFVCNLSFFITYHYDPVDLTPYITEETSFVQEDGTYRISEDNLTIVMEGMDTPIYNLCLGGGILPHR